MFLRKDFLLFGRVFLLWVIFLLFIIMRFFRLFFVFLLTQIILPAGVFAVGLTAEIGISPPRNEFSMDP